MHEQAVHSYECPACFKHFKSCQSKDQHFRAVHGEEEDGKTCPACSKQFKSCQARDQHFRSVHGDENDSDEEESDDDSWRPNPPVSTKGMWVVLHEFRGRKSFGYFECTCSKKDINTWVSAHAAKLYRQGCQKCERYVRPLFMWQNLESNDRDKFRKTDTPHDRNRCEACRAGDCMEATDFWG
jgi:hypothetical protein